MYSRLSETILPILFRMLTFISSNHLRRKSAYISALLCTIFGELSIQIWISGYELGFLHGDSLSACHSFSSCCSMIVAEVFFALCLTSSLCRRGILGSPAVFKAFLVRSRVGALRISRETRFFRLLAILHHLDARISVERLHGRRGKPSRVVIYFCKRETMFLLALWWSLHIFHRLSGPSILHHGAGSLMVRQSMNCFSNDASG